jgi:cardiolipin synthase
MGQPMRRSTAPTNRGVPSPDDGGARRRRERHAAWLTRGGATRAVLLALTALAAAALCGCGAREHHDAREVAKRVDARSPAASLPMDGNGAEILVDGPKAHQAMFDAMERTRDHINLQTYILEAGEIGEELARVVERKAGEGAKINILYDSLGSIATPREYFEQLRAAGAAVCEFNPVNPVRAKLGWRLNNRGHRKILVVDGRVAFTGGINMSSTYSSGSGSNRKPQDVKPGEESERGWRDTHVRVEGPVVERFQRLFLDSWALQQCGPIPGAHYFPPLGPHGDLVMRVLSSDPAAERSEMFDALLAAIDEATHRVWLTFGYFVPDPHTVQALINAARRGIDVRMILPGISDFWAPLHAGRSHYDVLLGAGVRIFELHHALLHAKTAVIDSRWASIGSTNLDWRSLVHNYEADLVVHDTGFARELEKQFELDLQGATEVIPDVWERRGPVDRIKEWFARQWEYLL